MYLISTFKRIDSQKYLNSRMTNQMLPFSKKGKFFLRALYIKLKVNLIVSFHSCGSKD